MGTSLLWLNYGLSLRILEPMGLLLLATGAGLLWATTRPRWEKAHCSWCMARVTAHEMKYDEAKASWIVIYACSKCGHMTEKIKVKKED